MADEKAPAEVQSDLTQQVDPNADLMKARPGGETEVVGKNPGTGFRDEKTDSTYQGSGSGGGYEDGPEVTYEEKPPA